MSSAKRHLILALAVSAAFGVASVVAKRIGPASPNIPVQIEGRFEPGGWYPGEAFKTAQPLRAWGSWCGGDENTGKLTLGPFPAPAHLRFAVGGYPTQPEIQLYAENVATKTRIKIELPDVGERWRTIDAPLPSEWRNAAIVIVAADASKKLGGWIAITEPLRGGADDRTALMLRRISIAGAIASVLSFLIGADRWRALVRRRLAEAATTRESSAPAPAWIERSAPWLAALVALVPLAWCARSFSALWWFGDDWDLLDQIARVGFWRWTLMPFAENFVPLFKVLWGGLALLTGGAYWPMIVVLWLTHAVNTALLLRLLRSVGFSWAATSFALAAFALSFANVETLAWSVQWSALLAITFFLLAAHAFWRGARDGTGGRVTMLALLALLSAASALAFARGVLTGAALAAVCLLPFEQNQLAWPARLRIAAACLLPAIGVAAVIFFFSPGNHHALGGHAREVVEFGLCYWAGTPLDRLLEFGVWEKDRILLLGLAKILIMAWAFWQAPPRQRVVLGLFLLLDLGNAGLLGIGRYQTGLPASNSERYQYNALLCTMPFLALMFDSLLALLPSLRLRQAFATVLILGFAWRVMHGWPAAAESFAVHRGRNTRELLLREPHPPAENAVPGIPFLPTARAKELIARYHLH